MMILRSTLALFACLLEAVASAGCSDSDPQPPKLAPGAIRGCGSVVGGTLPAGWRNGSVIAGPLALWFLGDDPRKLKPSLFAHLPGRPNLYRPYKVLAVVRSGAAVTLAIPEGQRGQVSLVYGVPRVSGGMRISQGFSGERFEACTNVESQFAGGFLVAGPRCPSLDVYAAGAKRQRIRIPFGAPCRT
jgi:hypothetical protein